MPYSLLTSVANVDTLLGEIRDFLSDTGDWTIHQNLITPDEDVIVPPGNPALVAGGRQLVASNGDCLVGLRSTLTGPGANKLYLFDGIPPWSGSPSLDSMNGNSGLKYSDSDISSDSDDKRSFRKVGPFPRVHLFTNDPSTYCHVVIEFTSGRFRHLHFGNLIKRGTWTGGGYYACSYHSSFSSFIDSPSSLQHNVPWSANSGYERDWTVHYVNGSDNWISGNTAEYTLNDVIRRIGVGTVGGGMGRAFSNLPETPYSGLISLVPVMIGAIRATDTPDTLRYIGQVPDLRAVNIQNLAPGQSYSVGSDEYVVFPWAQKNGGVGQETSGVAGFAYLKRT